ncbi:hypothetical protein ABZU32_08880 [Sphaerisporangium sp. NPDC005288]|uniref:hypothetical protein n=1 Tax=Sphaerisporangium sp. NPDC005288 TaxID=3155114 RepID=UPI0033A18390
MARQTTVHHIPLHAGWPDGEKPSGWPGTEPSKNVRDEYDNQLKTDVRSGQVIE